MERRVAARVRDRDSPVVAWRRVGRFLPRRVVPGARVLVGIGRLVLVSSALGRRGCSAAESGARQRTRLLFYTNGEIVTLVAVAAAGLLGSLSLGFVRFGRWGNVLRSVRRTKWKRGAYTLLALGQLLAIASRRNNVQPDSGNMGAGKSISHPSVGAVHAHLSTLKLKAWSRNHLYKFCRIGLRSSEAARSPRRARTCAVARGASERSGQGAGSPRGAGSGLHGLGVGGPRPLAPVGACAARW